MKYLIVLSLLMLSACAPQAPSKANIDAAASSCCLTEACTKFPVYEIDPQTGQSYHSESCFTPTANPDSCYKCFKAGEPNV